MRYGLIFSGGGTTIGQMVELAVEAEQAGVDSVYVTEAWRSAFVPLTAIAAATETVEIGTYIINAYSRSPWLAGMAAVDLDEFSGGRLVLGVGSGNKHINEDWQGIATARPLRKMEEYITLLRRIVAARVGEEVSFEGAIHQMKWSPPVQPARPAIPVFMAALYPKMIRLSGAVADGIAMGALLSPDYIREVVMPTAREGAEDAGRDPAALGSTLAPFVSVGEDAERARDTAREAICRLYSPLPHPYYDHVIREQGFSAAADAAAKYVPAGRIEKAAEAFTDDILDKLAIAGNPADCKDKLARFEGVTDQVLLVNVNYSSPSTAALVSAYRDLIALGAK